MKHVYILGAGFSRPLGGPLFNDLLSKVPFDEVSTEFFSLSDNEMSRCISSAGQRITEIRLKGLFASNAEELLEQLDSLAETKIRSWMQQVFDVFGGHSQNEPHLYFQTLCGYLAKRLAIETSDFLQHVPKESERWIPYDNWAKDLTKDDSIITFNYDLLVERVFNRKGLSLYRPTGQPSSNDSDPKLFKLHGSNDWFIEDSRFYVSTSESDWREKIRSENFKVILGLPGCGKSQLKKELLSSVWDQAAKAIQEANVVSIVGYSLPATDNVAREFILENLLAGVENKLSVNVVLGPNIHSENAVRIKEMLGQLFGGDELLKDFNFLVPAYAQDYLARYRPKNDVDILKRLAPSLKGSLRSRYEELGRTSRR